MPKVFFSPDGTPSPVPFSRAHAEESRFPRYDSGKICPRCQQTRIRYTRNRACMTCARIEAMHFYNYCVGASVIVESNLYFKRDNLMQPIAADLLNRILEARALFGDNPKTGRHDGNWLHPEPCKERGHFGVRNASGKCYFCANIPTGQSPRQAAISAGLKWYTPAEPCKRCKTTAERHVDNGRCRGCGNQPGTRSSALAGLPPDMVLTKADAQAFGFSVYRTGNPCKRGHRGFRYTVSGNCIDCRGKV